MNVVNLSGKRTELWLICASLRGYIIRKEHFFMHFFGKKTKPRSVRLAAVIIVMMLAVAVLISGCGRKTENKVSAEFVNNSDVTLEDVVLINGSDRTTVGNIGAGESVSEDIVFHEGNTSIEYTADGKKLTASLNVDYENKMSKAGTASIVYGADENEQLVFNVSTNTYFNIFLGKVDDWIWGIPLIALILLVGVLLTARTRFTQVFHLGKALKYMVKNEENGKGEVTSFGALCTALSATIGTGNIVGVATAVCAGGPGALFWMEVAAFFGMATKYAEGLLAVKYRRIDENGKVLGGPFYYIEKGLGKGWKWLAVLFAIFGVLAGLMGIGTITQINGITSAVQNFFDPEKANAIQLFGRDYSIATVIAGLVVTVCVALVVIGGIKRIAKVSEVVVPFMAILYVACALILILCNITKIPSAIVTIVSGAFNPAAVTGGAIGTIFIAMQKGIARGIFSNEAGLGSAPIAAAAAQTNQPVRQGLVCMTGTFFDTIIICTMTGLSIVMTGAWQVEGLEGAAVTTYAFQQGLPFNGSVSAFLLMICLIFFAFTTILGWDYYSEKCLQYLVGDRKNIILAYRWLYILAVFVGPYLTVAAVWTIADIFNGLMAFPNVIALIALSGVVAKETKMYIDGLKSNKLK